VCVVTAGAYCEVSRADWLALVLAMAMVWVAEALNTGIEWVVDLASPEHHPLAGKAKDVAAAGVLLASMAAVVVGLLVFVPRLL
jgi:diacylglycerol kinase (ATP)